MVTLNSKSRVISVDLPTETSLGAAKKIAVSVTAGIDRLNEEKGFFVFLDWRDSKVITPNISDVWIELGVHARERGLIRSVRIISNPIFSLILNWVGWCASNMNVTRTFFDPVKAEYWLMEGNPRVVPIRPAIPTLIERLMDPTRGERTLSEVAETLLDPSLLPRMHDKLSKMLLQRDDDATRAAVSELLGYSLARLGRLSEAEEHLRDSIQAATRTRDGKRVITSRLHLGEVLFSLGLYDEALQQVAIAGSVAENIRNVNLQDEAIERFRFIGRAKQVAQELAS